MAVVTGQTLGYVRAPTAWSACQILAAVRGVSMWRTPQGANASMTALATAAGAARVGNSPRPLTPSGQKCMAVSMTRGRRLVGGIGSGRTGDAGVGWPRVHRGHNAACGSVRQT